MTATLFGNPHIPVTGVNGACGLCNEFVYGDCKGYAGGEATPTCFVRAIDANGEIDPTTGNLFSIDSFDVEHGVEHEVDHKVHNLVIDNPPVDHHTGKPAAEECSTARPPASGAPACPYPYPKTPIESFRPDTVAETSDTGGHVVGAEACFALTGPSDDICGRRIHNPIV